MKVYSYNRRRIKFVFVMAALALGVIVGRLAYIMLYRGEYYSEKADSLHERERSIKAPRGRIYDRNGNIFTRGNVTSRLPGEKFWISMEIFWQITGQSVLYP